MKLFGEYLVEKKVITEETLVDALVEQLASIKTPVEIAYQLKLLNTQQFMEIFKFQQINKVNFMDACKKTGHWNEKIDEDVKKQIDGQRKPIGQILLDKKATDIKILTQNFDEYLSLTEKKEKRNEIKSTSSVEMKNENVSASANINEVRVTETASDEKDSKIAQNQIDKQVEKAENSADTNQVDQSIKMELEELFSESKLNEYINQVEFINQQTEVDTMVISVLAELLKDVHTYKGTCRFLNLIALENLFTSLENFINQVVSKQLKMEVIDVCSVLNESIFLAWKVRSAIISGTTENAYLSDSDNQKGFANLIDKLKV